MDINIGHKFQLHGIEWEVTKLVTVNDEPYIRAKSIANECLIPEDSIK